MTSRRRKNTDRVEARQRHIMGKDEDIRSIIVPNEEEYMDILNSNKLVEFGKFKGKKNYIDLDVGFFYQCYKNKMATEQVLINLRKHYPKEKVFLVSDNGDDFSDLADKYCCHFTRRNTNVGIKDIGESGALEFLDRINECCNYLESDWVITIEDDVLVRDRISKYPNAHIAGPNGPHISRHLYEYLKAKYPHNHYKSYGGCGGSIFHRKAYLECYSKIRDFDIKLVTRLDNRVLKAFDVPLTYVFLYNGFIYRFWLDHSEETRGVLGCAAAFDHQYKKFYGTARKEKY